MKAKRIYLASSWRNPSQPELVQKLRDAGHEVYDFRNPPNGTGFSWSEISPDWEKWTAQEYIDALKHPCAQRGFWSDYAAMNWADTFVLLLPCGRSAHLEAGWAMGRGLDTLIITQDGEPPELMALMAKKIVTNFDDAIRYLWEMNI